MSTLMKFCSQNYNKRLIVTRFHIKLKNFPDDRTNSYTVIDLIFLILVCTLNFTFVVTYLECPGAHLPLFNFLSVNVTENVFMMFIAINKHQ